MTGPADPHSETSESEPHAARNTEGSTLGRTVLNDLSRGDFQRSMSRDLEDIYQFYLDQEDRDRLTEMGSFSRWLHVIFWMLKNSFLRLPPPRRILILIALFLFVHGVGGNLIALSIAFVTLLLILTLELKDKLLAQNELETGRAVQSALLPKEPPVLAGWDVWMYTRPANEVGGDLVDYMPVHTDRMGIALGDVAGKGLGAALVMAKLQSTLRAITPHFDALSDLGTEVNAIFRRDGLPSRFISLVYLELTPASGRIRVLNAGHLPPFVIRRHATEYLERGGPALGLLDGAPFQEQCVVLEPGDYLVLYSDGLTEARNEDGEFLGDDILARRLPRMRGLPAETVGRRLLDAVDLFVGDARPSDDLSLVVLRRRAFPELGDRLPG